MIGINIYIGLPIAHSYATGYTKDYIEYSIYTLYFTQTLYVSAHGEIRFLFVDRDL